jgi:hypothetical protein
MTVFDIRRAIEEIIEIKIDQAIMKDIHIKTEYVNFGEDLNTYLIKTDQKRL